jgi:hypothetical protein
MSKGNAKPGEAVPQSMGNGDRMRFGVVVDAAAQVHRLIHPGAAPERGEFVAEERYAVNTVLGLFDDIFGQRSCHRPPAQKPA